MRLGLGIPLTQPQRPTASSFDPLNPPGGAPVAAWLASQFSVGSLFDQNWIDPIAGANFEAFPSGVTCVSVGGKKRVRIPAAASCAIACLTSDDPGPEGPFSIPTGACSIVLVSAALTVDGNGVVLGSITTDAAIIPSTDEGQNVRDGQADVIYSGPSVNTSPHVFVVQKSTNWRVYLDGVDVTTDASQTDEWGELWIGTQSLQYPNDDIVAILIFNRVLTSQEITDYTTWGIAEAG